MNNNCLKNKGVLFAAAMILLCMLLLFAGCNDDTISLPEPSASSGETESGQEETSPSCSPSYTELPIPYPSWFFSEEKESEEQPLAPEDPIKQIKKLMSYAQVSELLGFRGTKNDEYCVYDWQLEGGDLLQITFDFPQLFHYKSPDDMVVSKMRITPADESLPVRYSVYLPKAEVADVRMRLIEAYNWSNKEAAPLVDRVMKEYGISNDTASFPEGFYFYETVTEEDENPERLAKALLDEMRSRAEETAG